MYNKGIENNKTEVIIMTKHQIVDKYGKALASNRNSVTQAKGELEVRMYAYASGITFKKALKQIIEAYKEVAA
jgi:flavorubredoxin